MNKKLFWIIVGVGATIIGVWLVYVLWLSPNAIFNNQVGDLPKGERLKDNSPVVLDNLSDRDILSPGFILKGRAVEDWYREGSFPILLADRKGNILAQTFANIQDVPYPDGKIGFISPIFFNSTEVRDGVLYFIKMGPEGLPDDITESKDVLRIRVSIRS